MKTVFALVLILFSSFAHAQGPQGIDAKAIYEALDVKPVEILQEGTKYKQLQKRIIGFIDCRSTLLGWDVYQCSFGDHLGFSMFGSEYNRIKAEETLVRSNRKGDYYKKEVGGLECTRFNIRHPDQSGDYVIRDTFECTVKLKFGAMR